MRKVNWAILACGSIADKRIAPALVKSSVNKLAAIASRDEARGQAFAAKHGVEKAYGAYDTLLADPEVDVVYIGSPNALHHEHVLATCRAGKHVFCDKPLALTIADCQAMDKAARSAGVKLGVGFNNRYNPVHEELRRRLGNREIGNICHASLLFAVRRPRQRWRLDAGLAGAGCLNDLGVHAIDLLRFLLAEEVVSVSAVLDVKDHGWPLDAAVTGLLTFESGATADLTVSSKISHPRNGVSFYGDAGTLAGISTLVSQTGGFLPRCGQLEVVTEAGSFTRDDFGECDIFQMELDSFGRSVLEKTTPEIGARDGLRAQEIALAMQRSFRDGVTIKLDSRVGK